MQLLLQFNFFLWHSIICVLYISLYGFLRAVISMKLGDKSEPVKKRLALEPNVHIDLIGLLFMMFYGVGFVKPMINQSMNFKNKKGATTLIAVLPAVVLFTISTIIMWVYFYGTSTMEMPNGTIVLIGNGEIRPEMGTFLVIQIVRISLGTLLYNIIPIYPLEGEKILNYTVSPNFRFTWSRYNKALQMLLVGLTVFGVLPKAIMFICDFYISIFIW